MSTIRLKIKYNKNTNLIISPTEIMEVYMFGIPFCTADGSKFPSQSIVKHIESAQEKVENFLSLKINKQVIEENRDYVRQDFMSWGYVKTMYPVDSVSNLEGWINNVCRIKYPEEWISLKGKTDVVTFRNIYLIPNSGATSESSKKSIIYNGISPHVGWFGQDYIPNYWKIKYITGWNKVPSDLFDFISKKASINILSILGDFLYGVGITSINMSLDGVSQNTPLTRSSRGGMFAGRIKTYIEDNDREIENLKYKYRGITFEVL